MNVLKLCLILYQPEALPAGSPTWGFRLQLRHRDLGKLRPTLTAAKQCLFPVQM